MLLGLYFLILMVIPLCVGGYVVFNGLTRSRRCPSCGDDTLRLRSWPRRLGSRLLRQEELHLRWCMRCGWRGTARIHRLAVPRDRSGRAHPARSPGADRVDVRSIDLDGSPWRVMVECWAEAGRWKARLVFVAPGGQACNDRRTFEGPSAVAVISQAFAIPEPTLAGRLRRALG